jgi:GntR family transcriptional regulator / MocR family aminotransferase
MPLANWLLITLQRDSTLAKHRELYIALRRSIIEQRIKPGHRLPSTRALAEKLALSRNTVNLAYEQLIAENFAQAQPGAGTYVSHDIVINHHPKKNQHTALKDTSNTVSKRGRALQQAGARNRDYGSGLFAPCLADTREFPHRLWAKIYHKYHRDGDRHLLDFGYRGGNQQLRRVIADYLNVARATRCEPEQVIITNGTQQSLLLILLLLTKPGDTAWMEEPGWHIAQAMLESQGLDVCPAKVDDQGINIDEANAQFVPPKIIYVTPSYQYPMGCTLSLKRRLQLLAYAREHDSWILEDDYASEFSYHSRPVTSLQGLDEFDTVIYLGTFSKVLTPSLRLSYIVVPPQLVDDFESAYQSLGNESTLPTQAAMAEFIESGHFERHVRKMRAIYAERGEALEHALKQDNRIGFTSITAASAGLHLTCTLPEHLSDKMLSRRANQAQFGCRALSDHYMEDCAVQQALLLGYTSAPTESLIAGAARLMNVLETNKGFNPQK